MSLTNKTLRCSKLARYMECAGFLHLDVEETEAGDPAKEGTACGELLEAMIVHAPLPKVASNGHYIDDDMHFYMNGVASSILGRAVGPVLAEVRIDWQTMSGITIRGQYDACFVDERGYLCIEDLKYGWGIVEVKNNWQLIGYAIGEVIRRGVAFTHIAFRIHQPRPHHEDGPEREWIITYDELLAFKQQIEDRCHALVNGVSNFQTGKQCKYCPGAAEACTAFSRLFYRSIEISTEFFQDSLTNEEVAAQLDMIKRAEEVIKIKSDSLVELGNSRIKSGGIIPGYVQVPKYSHREWKQGVSAESIRVMAGVDLTEKVFMSPAKAEKLKVHKDLVKALTTTRLTGMKLEKRDAGQMADKIFGTTNPFERK